LPVHSAGNFFTRTLSIIPCADYNYQRAT